MKDRKLNDNTNTTTAKQQLVKLCTAAMFAALICVATMLIQIPSPLNGYVNFGDCFILVAAWVLGPVWGFGRHRLCACRSVYGICTLCSRHVCYKGTYRGGCGAHLPCYRVQERKAEAPRVHRRRGSGRGHHGRRILPLCGASSRKELCGRSGKRSRKPCSGRVRACVRCSYYQDHC